MTGAALDVVDLMAELAGIGRDAVRGGWTRPGLSDADRALHEWFARRAENVGLEVETDRNGNLWARRGRGPGAIAIGSHLDSVPGGGAYDGPLGVASALAVADRMRRSAATADAPVAVVVFLEEEGSRFGMPCLGSRLSAGALDPERARRLTDAGGRSFAEVAAEAGIDPAGLGADAERLAGIAAFVELHVEQGRALADLGRPIAVADAVLAHGRWRLAVTGRGDHAGSTRMRDRADPVPVVAAAALEAERLARAEDAGGPDGGGGAGAGDAAESVRATVGRVEVVPGGTNVIASAASAWLDVRADSPSTARRIADRVAAAAEREAADRGCALETAEESFSDAVRFDPALRDRLSALLDDAPVLSTGAGHDAAVLAARIRTAMLFVRNPTGVSHAPGEAATDDDCRAGVEALHRVVRELSSGAPRGGAR